jgi:hypothetical protein
MPFNRILLRITLILLGIAALAAVAAAFTGSTTALWRVVFTCIEAAIAAGALVRVSRFLQRPSQRPAAILGFACLLGSFGFFLVGTWIDTIGFGLQGQILGTAFAIAGLGGAATAALATRSRSDCVLAGPAAAIAAGMTLAATIAAIWTESDRLGAAAAAGGPVLLVASICLVGNRLGERPWRYLGLCFGLAAAAIGVQQAFSPLPSVELWNWYAALAAGALAVMHANLLMLLNLAPPWPVLRLVTIAASAGTAIGVGFSVFTRGVLNWQVLDEPTGRFTAAAGILAACGTLGLVARQRLGRRLVIDTAGADYRAVSVTCPRCSARQTAPVGDSPCTGCRLILSVRVSEPHCSACGYCLFDLKEDRCPECGQPIPPRGVAFLNIVPDPAGVAAG